MVACKLILALLFSVVMFGQQGPSISNSPGGGGSKSYPAGIPDPMVAPVVSVITTGTDTCTYAIVEGIGPGYTLPGPSTTVTNCNYGSMNVNITLPSVADPNIQCLVIVTAASTAPAIVYTGRFVGAKACDGSMVNDTGLYIPIQIPPPFNFTAGTVFPGLTGANPLIGLSAVLIQATNAGGGFNFNKLYLTDLIGSPAGWLGLDNQALPSGSGIFSGYGPIGGLGLWVNVTTCGGAGGSPSPCTLAAEGVNAVGFEKADTSLGDVIINLPPVSSFPPQVFLPSSAYGRIVWVHKPLSANSVTVQTTDGSTIGGSSTSITWAGQQGTLGVYWDADGDGNAGQWAFFKIPGFTGTQTVTSGCAVMGGVPTGCTLTTNTYTDGVLVSVSP